MRNAFKIFQANIRESSNLSLIYEHLASTIKIESFDDLLRSQLVYSVSAFDKLIHDLIRIGMVEIFNGRRQPTPKYLAEPISLEALNKLCLATISQMEKNEIFEMIIIKKLKNLSFQNPDKIADGLSYIWPENQKWIIIAKQLGVSRDTAHKTMHLIADRRNSIVHEADMDPLTNQKYQIAKNECDDVTDFLMRTGQVIFDLVQISS